MSNDTKPPSATAKPAKADDPKAGAKPPVAAKPAAAKPPPLDERPLRFVDLAPYAAQLEPDELLAMLRDGRGMVRANAALGLAAVNQPALELVMLLRDSEVRVAAAAAESIGLLGALMRPLVPQVTQSLDGAQPEVVDSVVGTLSGLVGK